MGVYSLFLVAKQREITNKHPGLSCYLIGRLLVDIARLVDEIIQHIFLGFRRNNRGRLSHLKLGRFSRSQVFGAERF